MPIIKSISPDDNTLISIWKIDESLEELEKLSTDEIKIKNENKFKEHVATREAIKYCCEKLRVVYGKIIKDDSGKPALDTIKEGGISISHKFPYAVGMVNLKNKCGVDIERIDEKIKKVKDKFLNENEKKFSTKNNEITATWSVKESSYKVEGDTIPLKEIFVRKVKNNLYESRIRERKYKVKTIEFEGHILSFTT